MEKIVEVIREVPVSVQKIIYVDKKDGDKDEEYQELSIENENESKKMAIEN